MATAHFRPFGPSWSAALRRQGGCMVDRDYRIEPDTERWRLSLIEDGEVVRVQVCELHDEALAEGTVWICEDGDDG
jgi:hypothetical protein